MLFSGIKSRPQYPGLAADLHAKHHVFVADAAGAEAVLDLFRKDRGAIQGQVIIVFASTAVDGTAAAELEKLGAEAVHVLPTIATAMRRLEGVLGIARMGTRIYAAGSESLIGLTIQLVQSCGLDWKAVITEHRGTLARRVQCVHCKGFTENVTTNIVKCSHCGTNLLVRDHYSRRLAAFQGVCIDAEVPGDLPDVEEVFK
jgi:hypothetical protein